jgi:hypothetical protein
MEVLQGPVGLPPREEDWYPLDSGLAAPKSGSGRCSRVIMYALPGIERLSYIP